MSHTMLGGIFFRWSIMSWGVMSIKLGCCTACGQCSKRSDRTSMGALFRHATCKGVSPKLSFCFTACGYFCNSSATTSDGAFLLSIYTRVKTNRCEEKTIYVYKAASMMKQSSIMILPTNPLLTSLHQQPHHIHTSSIPTSQMERTTSIFIFHPHCLGPFLHQQLYDF
mmetsp:Transcript_5110/g.6788  ORF Transcript_5110/g.6788 Transcript_5110/m.6788 type:complete len:168 (-) Transcript_5110:385-888(-)